MCTRSAVNMCLMHAIDTRADRLVVGAILTQPLGSCREAEAALSTLIVHMRARCHRRRAPRLALGTTNPRRVDPYSSSPPSKPPENSSVARPESTRQPKLRIRFRAHIVLERARVLTFPRHLRLRSRARHEAALFGMPMNASTTPDIKSIPEPNPPVADTKLEGRVALLPAGCARTLRRREPPPSR